MSTDYLYLDSSFVGPYYKICCDAGYPMCDIVQYDDGSWAIIEMLNAPLMPSYTKFAVILGEMQNVEINLSFVRKHLQSIDLHKPHFWEREEKKTQDVLSEAEAAEKYWEESTQEKLDVIWSNQDLIERVAKNGTDELLLSNIWKQLEPWERRRARECL